MPFSAYRVMRRRICEAVGCEELRVSKTYGEIGIDKMNLSTLNFVEFEREARSDCAHNGHYAKGCRRPIDMRDQAKA